jgi:hypothetical protein
MHPATAAQRVLTYSAPDTLRRQRGVGADGTIHLVVLPQTWRSDLKFDGLIGCALAAVACGFVVLGLRPAGSAPYPVSNAILLIVLIVFVTCVVWLPICALLESLFFRRVITVSIEADHVRIRWKRALWTSEMAWRRDRIASIRSARVWGRVVWDPVTARGGDGRTVFTVSAPDPEDVCWLAENLRRELNVGDAPS